MQKIVVFLAILFSGSKIVYAQQNNKPLWKNCIFCPYYNAEAQWEEAKSKAKASHKKLFVVVGGDWDLWSVGADRQLQPLFQSIDSFVYLRINFSPTNKNKALLDSLHCARDKGYPQVLVFSPDSKPLADTNL
ncbi:MAG: hypothetical protein EBX41_08550, partial [Chitinophagia bacterium]|nr:hypothetical protein [Chitinophagia bacterium]